MNQSHSPERNRCQGNRGIPEQEASPTARICRESPLTKGSRIILFFGKGAMRLSLPPARTGVGGAHQWVKGLVPCGFLGRSPKALLFSYNLANYKTHSSLFLLHRSFIAHLTLPYFTVTFIFFVLPFAFTDTVALPFLRPFLMTFPLL